MDEQTSQMQDMSLELQTKEWKSVKRKLFWLTFCKKAGLTLIAAGLIFFLCAAGISQYVYHNAMGVPNTYAPADREAAYARALGNSPSRTGPYLKLLELYGEDGLFSKEESERFLSLYNRFQRHLSWRDVTYAKLHYTAAFLYLNGYDGTAPSRLRVALPFLDTAMKTISERDPYYMTVACYHKMGCYYKTYIWDATAATKAVSAQTMQALIEEISTTLVHIGDNPADESLHIRLGFYASVCNLLYDQRNILSITVREISVQIILDEIYSNLPPVSQVQKEHTRAILNSLLENESVYRDMIHRAFERSDPS